jgi:hypothetical protein
VAQKSGD